MFSTALFMNKEVNENDEEVYTDVTDGMQVSFGGMITATKKITTKNGDFMCAMNVEDLYGQVECTLFPKNYERYKNVVEEDAIVKIDGRLQLRDDKPPSIIIEKMEPFTTSQTAKKVEVEVKKQEFLGINADKLDGFDELFDTLLAYPGDIQVYIKKNGEKFKVDAKVRKCKGLTTELLSLVDEQDIVFFTK